MKIINGMVVTEENQAEIRAQEQDRLDLINHRIEVNQLTINTLEAEKVEVLANLAKLEA